VENQISNNGAILNKIILYIYILYIQMPEPENKEVVPMCPEYKKNDPSKPGFREGTNCQCPPMTVVKYVPDSKPPVFKCDK